MNLFRRKKKPTAGLQRTSDEPPPPTTNPKPRLGSVRMNPFPFGGEIAPATRRPRDDPPPAYTPASSNIPTPQTTFTATTSPIKDDQFAFLSKFDIVFVIDDSGSMAGRSWRETSMALCGIAPICTARDADGIDIHFLNHSEAYLNVRTAADVERIFGSVQPGGGTLLGCKLDDIIRPYLANYRKRDLKPMIIIVITDGVPSDDPRSVIAAAAATLDREEARLWQLGVQFFQVGNELGAADYLSDLDDNWIGVRDIVDTVAWEGGNGTLSEGKIMKVTLGSVNRLLDGKPVKEL